MSPEDILPAIALYGHRFDLPEAVALRLSPNASAARPFFLGQLGLLVLAGGGGVATHVGALASTSATTLISLMAAMQLTVAWFNFRWWRAA